MKYVIYQLIQPDQLNSIDASDYRPTIIHRDFLEELNVPWVESTHQAFDSALNHIQLNADKLKHLKLTILPIIEISWDGSIRNF